ncbi:MAG: hypothetical protein NE327_10660 [Lentisphaeraceae bacterium]|nr:hypothetical protein [Lentisphaeraceae bacterium]
MHYKELCGKPYLSAEDIPENRDIPLIIEAVQRENAFNPKSNSEKEIGVIKFQNKELKMVMNVTNSAIIAKAYGTETKDWIGKKVILYRTMTKLMGEMVPCLRLKV